MSGYLKRGGIRVVRKLYAELELFPFNDFVYGFGKNVLQIVCRFAL